MKYDSTLIALPILLPLSSSSMITVAFGYGASRTDNESLRLNCLFCCGVLFPMIVIFTSF